MDVEEYRESARRLGEILDDAVMRDANQKTEMAIEAAGKKTLERLNQLVQKGYRPDFDMEFVGTIWLYHPNQNFNHRLLYLYPDGCVKSAGKTDDFRFDRHEDALFQKFLQSVPQPTFWDRTREGRTSFAAWIIIGSVCIGGGLLGFAAQAFYRSLRW